ncbi:MAG TPA: hypothetical protein DCO79_14625 [Spirochaeta sp.]|nr:hypothetical protein [Spirochaeta sp.]
MKKILYFVLILILITGTISVFAATPEEEVFNQLVNTLVGTMEADFSLLLDGLGQDIDPILMQNAMVGQNVGMAELGSEKFDNFYFSILPTISITAANGIFSFTDTQAYEDSLVLKGMLDSFLFNEPDGLLSGLSNNSDIGDILINKVTPIPAFKMNAGFRLPADLEVLLHGMWIPDFLASVIPEDALGEIPAPTFTYLNIGAEVRYVLLRDGDKTPGMSIGLAGAYNHLLLEMNVGSLLGDALGGAVGTVPDGMTNPFLDAGMKLESNTIVFGINTALSKKLAFFYPFIKIGAWYGISEFGGEVVLTETATIEGGDGHNGLDLLASTGFDLMLGPFGSNVTIDYNLGTGIWGLNLGSRLQF